VADVHRPLDLDQLAGGAEILDQSTE